MTNAYAGLCVGGPMAGKRLSHWSTTYTLESISGYTVEYTHRPLSDECALWVPRDESIDMALAALGRAYVGQEWEKE